MEIFNVLFKGFNVTPFPKAFLKEDEARKWIKNQAENRGLTIKSSFGWNDRNDVDDYRCEDATGNSYYFVIYREFLTTNEEK